MSIIDPAIEYPAHFESDVVLRNGRTLRIRPVRPTDRDSLLALFRGLSPDSLHSRFFDVRTPDAALRDSPADVDYDADFGVVGELGTDIIGIAHFFRIKRNPKVAEVAFTIADSAQGCGVGTHLLTKLAQVARTKNIDTFIAEVLPTNRKMLDVFLLSGFAVRSKSAEGTVHVAFPIESTSESETKSAERSQKAAYASMRSIFHPQSIAVVGASRRRGNLGAEILHNLSATGFKGELYAINPLAKEIEGVKSFPSVNEIPGQVDLAVIAVPAPDVEAVIDDCIKKKVAALVVITAGFAETGEKGRAIEQRLLEKVRNAGMRMVGPNCMGVINTDPAVHMHATFTSIFPPAGNVAMSSQSGALGLAILDYARSIGVGFSTFISVGNKADVSGNDLIQYWSEDPNTDVMLLYLESFGNPRKFGEIARRVARRKPIVAVKSGRSKAGARAAKSHTGALAESDAIVRDLFKQAGIIRTDTLEEMFDIAAVLANQPLPLGRRVAIVTNAGGPGILAADACETRGLELMPIEADLAAKMREYLPATASVGNPIDMIASASASDYRRTLKLLTADPSVDSIIVIYIPVLPDHAHDVAAAIRECAADAKGKTMVATFMGSQGVVTSLDPVPAFPFPERAVAALSRATNYAEWRRRPIGAGVHFDDVDIPVMREIVQRKLAAGGGWLGPLDVQSLLDAAKIPTAPMDFAATVYDAVQTAMRIGFPVVLKAVGATLLHKTDAGAVVLNLQDEREVRVAYEELEERLEERMSGVLVQRMVDGGVEVMLGATEDPTFGHVVAYGAGGTLVELMNDVSFRIHPLNDVDVEDMIDEVRWSKLLQGFRGAPPCDVAALKDVILRLSELLRLCPEIRDLDINPLKVLPRGAISVDARIRVEAVVPRPPSRRIAY